jgi:hypothetical protein
MIPTLQPRSILWRRFNIPAFIVRLKADNHIRQTMKDLGYTKKRKAEKERFYTKAYAKFVNDTRTNLEDALRSAKLPDQRVYIVSSEIFVVNIY